MGIKYDDLTKNFKSLESAISKISKDDVKSRNDVYTRTLLINIVGSRDIQVTITDIDGTKKITLGDYFNSKKSDSTKYNASDIQEIKLPRSNKTITISKFTTTKGGVSREIHINKGGEPVYTITNGVYNDKSFDFTFTDLSKIEAVYDPNKKAATYYNNIYMVDKDCKSIEKVEAVRPKDAVKKIKSSVKPKTITTNSYIDDILNQYYNSSNMKDNSMNKKFSPGKATAPTAPIKKDPLIDSIDESKNQESSKKHINAKKAVAISIITTAIVTLGLTAAIAVWGYDEDGKSFLEKWFGINLNSNEATTNNNEAPADNQSYDETTESILAAYNRHPDYKSLAPRIDHSSISQFVKQGSKIPDALKVDRRDICNESAGSFHPTFHSYDKHQ